MKVILRPLVVDPWSGVNKFRNCNEDLGSYFTRSGRKYTGLTEADAKRLGEKLGQDLSPNSDFWLQDNFFIRTKGKDVILDTEDPLEELKYLFLKSHKRVKNSLFERKATANFVLINEEEEAKKSNIYNKAKRQAIRAFDQMSTEDVKKALRLYGKRSENMSTEVAENRLFDIIDGDPQGFLNKWVNNSARDTQYLIERAVSEGVIRKNKRQYSYGTETLGYGMEDVIVYMDDPKNQDLRIAIKSEVESKSQIPTPQSADTEDGPVTSTWAEEAVAKRAEAEKPKDNVELKPEHLFNRDEVEEVMDTPKEIKKTTKK